MSIYAPVTIIGGRRGAEFLNYSANGKVLERIMVWAGEWQIKAIRVWMTGDAPVTYGNPGGRVADFAFTPGERITKLSLWGNGAGTRTGAIRFETSMGRTFDFGMTKWGRKTEYPVDTSSQICVGVRGRSGADIDALGFVFLNPIAFATLTDVQYPTLTPDTRSIAPVSLSTFSDSNTSSIPRSYRFTGTRTEEVSETWATTMGLEVYMEVTVTAGVPQVASVGTTFGWKLSVSSTYSLTQRTTRTLTWENSGTLQPQQRVSLVAMTRRGDIFIPYTGRMVVTLKSGETFSYNVNGNYRGVQFTGVEIVDAAQAVALQTRPIRIADVQPDVAVDERLSEAEVLVWPEARAGT